MEDTKLFAARQLGAPALEPTAAGHQNEPHPPSPRSPPRRVPQTRSPTAAVSAASPPLTDDASRSLLTSARHSPSDVPLHPPPLRLPRFAPRPLPAGGAQAAAAAAGQEGGSGAPRCHIPGRSPRSRLRFPSLPPPPPAAPAPAPPPPGSALGCRPPPPPSGGPGRSQLGGRGAPVLRGGRGASAALAARGGASPLPSLLPTTRPEQPGHSPAKPAATGTAGLAARAAFLGFPQACDPGQNLICARSLHEARCFVVKPGMPVVPLTPQHNSASASAGARCQHIKLAQSNRSPSALPASLTQTITAAWDRQPWCHRHPPAANSPTAAGKTCIAPTIQCSTARCSNP